LTVSYEAIEVPAEPKPVDPVDGAVKAEPVAPKLPAAGVYGASDIRAKKLGLYAVSLRKWGRGLIEAIEIREIAAAAIIERQQAERAAAIANIDSLNAGEP